MAIESNWGNCEPENITKDLISMRERMAQSTAKKFISIYPAWVRNYTDKFGLVARRDFKVSEHCVEVK